MATDAPPLLLVGCGAFGRVHLAALARLGLSGRVLAFDPDPGARAAAPPGLRFAATLEEGLATCRAAILATPVPTHAPLAAAALRAGLDLLLEKPATETSAEAESLAALAAGRGRIVQVGLYFRFQPKAQALRAMAARGELGRPHYVAARFSGLKRARADSGALLNDAVHFADLLPWVAGEAPAAVFAQTADPLGRGLEDVAVLQLRFPSGLIGLIEAGCALPGRWPDAVVPGAETRKEVVVAGSEAVAEVDFAAEEFAIRRGAHAAGPDGAWHPHHAPREVLAIPAADPVEVVVAELAAFLGAVATRRPTGPDLVEGGVRPLRILDAARRSAQEGRVVEIPACG
jgi:predicted dehydrogenase